MIGETFTKGDRVMLDLNCPLEAIFYLGNLYSFSCTKEILSGKIAISANETYNVSEVYINTEGDIGLVLAGVNDTDKTGYLDGALFTKVKENENEQI